MHLYSLPSLTLLAMLCKCTRNDRLHRQVATAEGHGEPITLFLIGTLALI